MSNKFVSEVAGLWSHKIPTCEQTTVKRDTAQP